MKAGHSSKKGRIFQNLIEYFVFVHCTHLCMCVGSVLVKCDQWGVAAEEGMQECKLSEAEQAGQKILQKKEKTLTTDVYMSLC